MQVSHQIVEIRGLCDRHMYVAKDLGRLWKLIPLFLRPSNETYMELKLNDVQ